MTREEYIGFANALKNNYTIDFDKLPEFCEMAISALSAPTANVISIDQANAMIKSYVSHYEEDKSEWIPVTERLPKIADVYRVTRRLFDNQIDTEPYYMVDACFFDGTNTWHNDNRINHKRGYADDVIAWQENPEPYKADMRGET